MERFTTRSCSLDCLSSFQGQPMVRSKQLQARQLGVFTGVVGDQRALPAESMGHDHRVQRADVRALPLQLSPEFAASDPILIKREDHQRRQKHPQHLTIARGLTACGFGLINSIRLTIRLTLGWRPADGAQAVPAPAPDRAQRRLGRLPSSARGHRSAAAGHRCRNALRPPAALQAVVLGHTHRLTATGLEQVNRQSSRDAVVVLHGAGNWGVEGAYRALWGWAATASPGVAPKLPPVP